MSHDKKNTHRVSEENCPLLEVLEAVRPHLDMTFENVLAHINTIYVLKTKQGAMGEHERYLRLKVHKPPLVHKRGQKKVFFLYIKT